MTPKEILSQIVLCEIYNNAPEGIGAQHDIINGCIVMVDGGPMECVNVDVYPHRYQESTVDKYWTTSFAKYVAKWFWRMHPMPAGHEFFLAKTEIDDAYNIKVVWGTR